MTDRPMTLDEIKAAAENLIAVNADHERTWDEYHDLCVAYAPSFARALLAALPVVEAAREIVIDYPVAAGAVKMAGCSEYGYGSIKRGAEALAAFDAAVKGRQS